jgi:hypothetical protein
VPVKGNMRRAFAIVTLSLFALLACTSDNPDGLVSGPNKADVVSQDNFATNSSDPGPSGCTGQARTSFEGKRMAIRLRITPCRVVVGDAPKVVLVNVGDGELGYTFGFKLERRTEQGWRWVNKRQGFLLPLFYLAAGKRSDPESLDVYFNEPKPVELWPGLYRVTKGVDLAPGTPRPPTMDVTATFQVIRP